MTSNNILKNVANGQFFQEVLDHVRRYTCNYFCETPFKAIERSTDSFSAIPLG